jgi:hypothetical protein
MSKRVSASEARAKRVRELEDEVDRAAVERARKEEGSVAWVVIKRELVLARTDGPRDDAVRRAASSTRL